MRVKVLASGSKGNAVWVSDGQTPLLLECGRPVRELLRSRDFRLSGVRACLVSHEHVDHSLAVRDLTGFGVPVWCSAGTAAALGIAGEPGVHACLRHQAAQTIGSFTVVPVSVCHDAAEPLGFFLLSQADGERLIFITDTREAAYRFPPAHHILVECNHMGVQSMADTNAIHASRVLKNHMSLADCLAFLRLQDLSLVQDIRLIHISHTHGDPDEMRRAAAAATGKRVIVCGAHGDM